MNTPLSVDQVFTASTLAAGKDADYCLAEDVVLLKAWDGTARLLDLNGQFFGLTAASGDLLLAALRHGRREAARAIARRFAVPVEGVEADLRRFLLDLHERGLIVPGGDRPRRRPGTRLAAWLVGNTIRLALRTVCDEHRRARILLSLAALSFRLMGWGRTVALCRTVTGNKNVAAESPADEVRLQRIDRTVRTAVARHLLPVDCKARALCCWILLRAAQLPAQLVVGIDLFPFLGHCWCESGPHTVADLDDRRSRFVPVVQYN